MRRLVTLFALLFLPVAGHAGQLTGLFQRPNGIALPNSTLTLSLSQAGYVVSAIPPVAVTTTPFSCGTDSTGNVRGMAAPLVVPLFSVNLGAGTLPAATYFITITYWNLSGQTEVSPEVSAVLSGPGTLTINPPLVQPATASGYRVYVSSATGTETLQGTVTGWGTFAISAPLVVGSAMPPSNTTTCTFQFNDTIIPSFTHYTFNVVDSSGSQVGGYPQDFYLTGSSVDVGNMTPAGNLVVRFPNAIISQPPGQATQSILGSLNMNGYSILNMLLGPLAGNLNVGNFAIVNAQIDANANPLSHLLQSTASNTPSADVAITANALNTITSVIVTMPSVGGPFRALASYNANTSNGLNPQTYVCFVGDGSATMAGAQNVTSASAVAGLNSFQVSPVTYANGAVVTFTLKCTDFATGGTVSKLGSGPAGVLPTTLSVSVMSAN